MKNEIILKIRNLSVSFKTDDGEVNAVRGIDLDLRRGETVAIVGESGSGKSVSVRTIMGILGSNGIINSGSIEFTYEQNGQRISQDLLQLSRKELRKKINGKHIAMVFQDPMTSLNPTMSVGRQLMEGMLIHEGVSKKEAFQKAIELLETVGITEAEKRMKSYPHQLSGGMRQRVVIATALSCNPDILICDEPTTALDVTIQAKILELILQLQKRLGVSVIYITHDLGVVAKVADYVSVMYAGRIIEKGTAEDIFYHARHPYTWGLLSAIPAVDTDSGKLYTIPGNPPNLLNFTGGDPFAQRNQYALNIDKRVEPPLFKITDTHYAATWLLDPRAPQVHMPWELDVRIRHMLKEDTYGL